MAPPIPPSKEDLPGGPCHSGPGIDNFSSLRVLCPPMEASSKYEELAHPWLGTFGPQDCFSLMSAVLLQEANSKETESSMLDQASLHRVSGFKDTQDISGQGCSQPDSPFDFCFGDPKTHNDFVQDDRSISVQVHLMESRRDPAGLPTLVRLKEHQRDNCLETLQIITGTTVGSLLPQCSFKLMGNPPASTL